MNEKGGRHAQWRIVDDISKITGSDMFEDALHVAGFDICDEEVEVEIEVGMDVDGEGGTVT